MYFDRQFRRRTSDALSPAGSLPVLEEARRTIGSAKFSAQYLQNPVYGVGNLIRPEWFGSYGEPPPREHFEYVVQSWDTGMTAELTSTSSKKTTKGAPSPTVTLKHLAKTPSKTSTRMWRAKLQTRVHVPLTKGGIDYVSSKMLDRLARCRAR